MPTLIRLILALLPFLCSIPVCFLPLCLGSRAAAASTAVELAAKQLAARYDELVAHVGAGALARHPVVEAVEENGRMRGDVYGVIERPFRSVAGALGVASHWCDIVPLHLNMKSCTYEQENGRELLTLYVGRKYYQEPARTSRQEYTFEVKSASVLLIQISLRAERGPLRTRNYALDLNAMPVAGGSTFLHFTYSYEYGLAARMAMRSYLATLGRRKIGFSVVGQNGDGTPVHVRGVRGVIERNAMRYHLATQAYLDTLDVEADARFERRIRRWSDLTARYPAQLYELDQQDYLESKRRERANQRELQRELDGER